jgi:hypothetical protein
MGDGEIREKKDEGTRGWREEKKRDREIGWHGDREKGRMGKE